MGEDFDIQKKAIGINIDTMKLLTVHPLFQEKVREARKRFGIKEGGIKDSQKIQNWQDAVVKKTDEYTAGESFKNRSKTIFQAFESGEISYKEQVRLGRELDLEIPINAWQNTIHNIALRFALGANFHEAIRYYILCGYITSIGTNYNIRTNPKNLGEVSLVLFGDIKVKEMKEAVKTAQKIARKRNPRWPKVFKPKGNIDRDLKIAQLTNTKNKRTEDSITKDEDIAAKIFDEDIDFKKMKETDRKNANKVVQARKRLGQALRDRFPDDTFAS